MKNLTITTYKLWETVKTLQERSQFFPKGCATSCGVFHYPNKSHIERAVGSSREKLDPQTLRSDKSGGNVPPPDDPRPYLISMQFVRMQSKCKEFAESLNMSINSLRILLRDIGAVIA